VENPLDDQSTEREEAFIYDLHVAPLWREPFNQLLDEKIKVPAEGRILEVACGTGGYSVGLASTLGPRLSVLGVDSSQERLSIARAKAGVKKLEHIEFRQGSLTSLELPDNEFDLVIGDASMWPPDDLPAVFDELRRVARPGAVLATLIATRGTFDEFHSIFWESLHELNLDAYTPQLEALIAARPTTSEAKQLALKSHWRNVHSDTIKHRLDFESSAVFLTSPLFEKYFFPEWFGMIADAGERQAVREGVGRIIDRESHDITFDLSIKATIISGHK
jgi:ubiquinone/menaquinone biosynthesis C-methylase UbiE